MLTRRYRLLASLFFTACPESKSKFLGLSGRCGAVGTTRSSGTVTVGARAVSWGCVTVVAEFPSRPVFGSACGTCLLPVLVMRWWC